MGVTIADDFAGQPEPDEEVRLRRIKLTRASDIKPKRVRWLWKGRVAYGTISLLAGREGLGKSTLAYQLAADVTKGLLEGEDHGRPRSVLVCASEDSWEHTIVPRLIAAGADRDLIYRVEMITYDEIHLGLSLPRDFSDTAYAAHETGAGLMILDPLMSVVDAKLDTHRDREVRQALDPLVNLAEETRMSIIGLMHHNKSGSTDAQNLVMGSRAFAAVARSVHTCIPDPDDDTQTRRLFATTKNNLGRLDLPVLGFEITGHAVETEDDGLAWTGRLKWTGQIEGNMNEIMARTIDPERTASAEAADWLRDYLVEHGGECAKTDIEKAGRVAGHSPTALRRARERLRLRHQSAGFPRQTFWSLPGAVDQGAEPDKKPVDITEPRHPNEPPQPPEISTPETVVSPELDLTDTTGASRNPVASDTVASTPPDPSRVTVASPPDATDTTGPDLRKREPEPALAYARAHTRGEPPTDTTDSLTPLSKHPDPTIRTVVPVASEPPRARTPARTREEQLYVEQLAHQPPTCPDCGNPIDSPAHERTCEAP